MHQPALFKYSLAFSSRQHLCSESASFPITVQFQRLEESPPSPAVLMDGDRRGCSQHHIKPGTESLHHTTPSKKSFCMQLEPGTLERTMLFVH